MPKPVSKPRPSPRKDLHDGTSLWTSSRKYPVHLKSQNGAHDTEIAVVGGGISGSLIALVLSEAGYQVSVLDRRQPGEGSTLASTAMIQFEIDTPLMDLKEKIGAARAHRAYKRSYRAIKDLKSLLGKHDIDASWVDRHALYLAGNETGFRGLKAEAAARAAIDLPSQYLDRHGVQDMFGIETTGAIYSAGAAELDPIKASSGALRAAQKLGATVISPCEVTGVDRGGDGVVLTTAKGSAITCRRAIFATGYEVVKGVPRSAFDIVSSWAIATKPIPQSKFWPTRCLIWEAADPYLYLRSTADNRVLIGGEDSGLIDPERREGAIYNKSHRLIAKARKLLDNPDLEIDYAWAGAFADSPTGLPYFEELDGMPNAFAVLGCGGNGITFSMIAAQVVKAWAAGRTDPDADLFCSP